MKNLTLPGRPLLFICATLLFSSCATNSWTSRCGPGEQPAVMDSLYFGTAKPGGEVTAAEWQRFVATVITPRFPKGITSWNASGQWQNAAGRLERENSHVVHIVHAASSDADKAIREIIADYKKRFRQEAVLRVRSPACISF